MRYLSTLAFALGMALPLAMAADDPPPLDAVLDPAAGGAMPLDCLIEPHLVIEVSSAADGVLETLEVDKSQVVQKGQVLATLESSVERATVRLARAKASMKDDIASKRANLQFAERKQARINEMYRKKAIAFHQKDEADTDVRVARAQLQQAEQNLRFAELELARTRAMLALRTVRSPIDAVVVEKLIAPGESVEDRPLVRLAQLDPLKVEVIAPANMFGTIAPGAQVAIQPETMGGARYVGTVSVVDRIIDAASGTFGVQIELANPDLELPSGLKCTARFMPGDPEPIAQDGGPAAQGQPSDVAMTTPDAPSSAPTDPTADSHVAAAPPVQPAAETPAVAHASASPVPDLELPTLDNDDETLANTGGPEPMLADPLVCATVGPIGDQRKADKLAALLAAEVARVSPRMEQTTHVQGYSVVAPQQPSRADTRALMGQLRATGFRDYALLRRGPNRGRLSLGYFSKKQYAEKRRAWLAARGFKSSLSAREREETMHWLDLEVPAMRVEDRDLAGTIRKVQSGLTLDRRPCAQLAQK